MTINKTEIAKSAWDAGLDIVKLLQSKGGNASPSVGLNHAKILAGVAIETIDSLVQQPTETDEEFVLRRKITLTIALEQWENGSACRQNKDVKAIIGETVSNSAEDLAAKYGA